MVAYFIIYIDGSIESRTSAVMDIHRETHGAPPVTAYLVTLYILYTFKIHILPLSCMIVLIQQQHSHKHKHRKDLLNIQTHFWTIYLYMGPPNLGKIHKNT